MAVFVVGQIKIKNQVKWDEYKSKVGDTLKPYGAKILFRGSQSEAFVGELNYPDIVAIEFDSKEVAKAWYNSKEYQSIVATRQKGADIILHMYE